MTPRSSSLHSRPLGVFDSGVGGLTVFKALKARLPLERIIYFGDTARLPYGSKSREAVTRFSLQIARFLSRQHIKLLVVACNSASALALDALQAAVKIPVVGVIDPAVRTAAAASIDRCIGVIGTEATISSGVYPLALKKLIPGVRVLSCACPLLVPLVEEGWWTHSVTHQVVDEYLKSFRRHGVDVLILGCTHYPLIRPLLQRAVGPQVRLIDSGEEVAREVDSLLVAASLKRMSGHGSESFFVSDGPERFRRLARRFLGRGIARVGVVPLE